MEGEEARDLEALKKTHQELQQLYSLLRHLRIDLEKITKNYNTEFENKEKHRN